MQPRMADCKRFYLCFFVVVVIEAAWPKGGGAGGGARVEVRLWVGGGWVYQKLPLTTGAATASNFTFYCYARL